jgi:hypothetical protein
VLEGSAEQELAIAVNAIVIDLGARTDLGFIAKGVPSSRGSTAKNSYAELNSAGWTN